MPASGPDHRLETRARMLAQRMQTQVGVLRNAVAPPGDRLPFTTQFSKPEALNWWRQHRYDDLGKRVVSGMGSTDVLELDAALARHTMADSMGDMQQPPSDPDASLDPRGPMGPPPQF